MTTLGEISKHFEPKPAPEPKAPSVHPDIIEALHACEEYFDNRSDADHDGISFVPNKEMRLLCEVRAAIKLAGG